MKSFYQFNLKDNTGAVFLNKEHIVSIKQTGIGFGSEITMSNGVSYNVHHAQDQILTILEEKP